jgi:hypothetical protein
VAQQHRGQPRARDAALVDGQDLVTGLDAGASGRPVAHDLGDDQTTAVLVGFEAQVAMSLLTQLVRGVSSDAYRR